MGNLQRRLKWGWSLGGGPMIGLVQYVQQGQTLGLAGIILFLFVTVNLGKFKYFYSVR